MTYKTKIIHLKHDSTNIIIIIMNKQTTTTLNKHKGAPHHFTVNTIFSEPLYIITDSSHSITRPFFSCYFPSVYFCLLLSSAVNRCFYLVLCIYWSNCYYCTYHYSCLFSCCENLWFPILPLTIPSFSSFPLHHPRYQSYSITTMGMQTQSLTGDITLLPISSLTDHNITSHVASRFLQGMPYITISTGTLVALNTNEPVDINQELVFRDLAARIYNRLVKRGENQLAIFLGETGSGKTEFRDFLVSHILSMNSHSYSFSHTKI